MLYEVANVATVANHNANYLDTTYRFDNTRLRVNTAPDADLTNYDSWAIAQGHPILAQGCSEIIVDFAADLNGNGRIDREFNGGTDNNGAIYWYDALKQGNFVWANPTTPSYITGTPPQPLVTNNANQRIFVFRADDNQEYSTTGSPVSSWPYLIRIRYRLHDTRGRLESNYAAALTDGLDNDGDGVIDAVNGDADEDRISGRWFERIISVPRP
jgi:hypothetical protein